MVTKHSFLTEQVRYRWLGQWRADTVTRRATPEELDKASEWQQGPEFRKRPEVEWPVKMASEIVPKDAGNVKR